MIIEYVYIIEGGYNEVIEIFILKKIISLTCKIYILLPNKTFLKETIMIWGKKKKPICLHTGWNPPKSTSWDEKKKRHIYHLLIFLVP